MKKLLTASIVFFALCAIMLSMSCKNGNTEKEDPSTYTLIGTWEASGEFKNMAGDTVTYTSTLTFTETDFTQIARYRGTIDFTTENEGTYIREEDKISYVSYNVQNDNKIGPFEGSFPYKFINKNTLETTGINLLAYVTSATFRRKS